LRELETSRARFCCWRRAIPSASNTSARRWPKSTCRPSAAEKSLQAYADELLLAAQRGELADAYARLHETAERALISRAISLAHDNQAKAARWLGIFTADPAGKIDPVRIASRPAIICVTGFHSGSGSRPQLPVE